MVDSQIVGDVGVVFDFYQGSSLIILCCVFVGYINIGVFEQGYVYIWIGYCQLGYLVINVIVFIIWGMELR